MTLNLFGEAIDLGFLPELLLAYLLALPLAYNRERDRRGAGLRTFPIVSLASCAFLLVAEDLFRGHPDALARVFYGLMTGIGFIGGGAIVKQAGSAHGTATAAAIWSTGAVGAAVALGYWAIAVSLALLTFLTFLVFGPVKGAMDGK